MALPAGLSGKDVSLADAVEASLADLEEHLQVADLALITSIRIAAEMIDDLVQAGEPAKAMSYMYLVRDGMDKLGGSVKARKDLGTTQKRKKSRLAEVRDIRSGSKGGTRKAAGSA